MSVNICSNIHQKIHFRQKLLKVFKNIYVFKSTSKFWREIIHIMPNYNVVNVAQYWRDFSLFTTPSLLGCNFASGGSFLFNISTTNVVFNVVKSFRTLCTLVDIWTKHDMPLLFTCFGGDPEVILSIMPWFQGSGRGLWDFKSAIFNFVLLIGIFISFYHKALRGMSWDLKPDDKSKLVQAMAWCHQMTNHYLNQC